MSSPMSILDHLDNDVLGIICECLENLEEGLGLGSKSEEGTKKSSLDSLSLTCKRLRTHSLPYVFQNFRLYHYGNPWDRAMTKLKDWNPDYSPFVREIFVSLELDYQDDPELFAEELPDILANALSRISTSSSRIGRMTCIINEDRAHLFADAFSRHNLTFPSVKKLVVGPYNDYAVKHCPNVEYLSVNDWLWLRSKKGRSHRQHSLNLIEKAGTLSHLQVFVMVEWWTEDLLIALYNAIPHIKTLIIPTSIIDMMFETFVTHLSRFRRLEILSVPSTSRLNIGFNPRRCGNAYDGPGGDELSKRVDREGQVAQERAATEIFDKCPWLKELWFENFVKVTVNHGEVGSKKRDLVYHNNCPITW